MNRLSYSIVCAVVLVAFTQRSHAQRQEIFGAWDTTFLGVGPPEFRNQGFRVVGRTATFDGILGGSFQPFESEGVDPVPAIFDASTGKVTVLDDTPFATITDISDNGHIVIEGYAKDDGFPAVLLIETMSGTQQVIDSGPGLHEGARVNSLGEVAHYNNFSGVWVWPQMINLPIAEEPDPVLVLLGEVEVGQVNVYAFSDEGWVGGRIITSGPNATQAFMWNFQTDELFRLDDSRFSGVETQVTAIGPDGEAIVEVGPFGHPEEVYRWNGTLLEPLDPLDPFFVGRFPMFDVNASGQAVGGGFGRINDAGQVLFVGADSVFDPECRCQRELVTLSRGAPLHIEGDYDASGKVDQGDLDLVLLHWGGEALPDDWYHDFPDLPIDQGELDTVLLRWGRSDGTPVLPGAGSVPEPATLTALLIALFSTGSAGVGVCRRTRQRSPEPSTISPNCSGGIGNRSQAGIDFREN